MPQEAIKVLWGKTWTGLWPNKLCLAVYGRSLPHLMHPIYLGSRSNFYNISKKGILLSRGDPGYSLREHMMTPIDNAVEDSPEGRYNVVQKRARSTIERTFGILKGR
ncbi:hypothetical protein PYW08_009171 [Mythimna loreyi]|uniref:Uncharacterized protein n=1 Tax=Mythimna loreyi TaxID=667449 RepID=A0ACC2QAH7_9NEOP|nr:hypothetical protein PYW08_009171 [Mythimna loreyi]